MKITTVALLAGFATFAAVLPGHAQFNVPGTNQGSPNYDESDYRCHDEMGRSPHISAAQVRAIRDQLVWLQPICENVAISQTSDYGTLFLDGNASALRGHIAANPTLMAELTEHDYDQHDVISIVYGANDSILLYVHQRDVR